MAKVRVVVYGLPTEAIFDVFDEQPSFDVMARQLRSRLIDILNEDDKGATKLEYKVERLSDGV